MTSKWSKYYTIVQPTPSTKTIQDSQDVSGGTLYNSHSWYQRLVQGSSTRMTRYREYDGMDNDVDVARALDTISEEMTQMNRKTKLHVDLVLDEIDGVISNTTSVTLSTALRFWCKSHNFDKTLFNIARTTVKYGDCFFRKGKSPTKKWEYIHCKNVIACVVDANDVTNIVAWQIRLDTKQAQANLGGIGISGQQYESEFVPADEIIRFTLNDDMSETAPFGESILKPVYRSFKQKELLEDAIIIYRISRAPERRVFYIDTGKMPPQRTKQYLEQVKNEIKQKKIPTQNGAGDNQVESIYNPHSTSEDFFFAQRCLSLQEVIPLLDGRTLTLSQLIEEHNQGKQNYVYSVDQKTGKFIPGEIEWAGITRKNAELVEVLLDNGEKIICTPDHKFVLRDGSEMEAQNLIPQTSLMPLYRKRVKTNKNQRVSKYEMILDNSNGKWNYTHLVVQPKCGYETVIHHQDYNPSNNSPTNLMEMSKDEHWKIHSQNGHNLQKMWDTKRNVMLAGIRHYHDNLTIEQQNIITSRNTKNGSSTWIKHKDQIIESLKNSRELFSSSFETLEEKTKYYQNMSKSYWDNISEKDLLDRKEKQIQYNKKAKSYQIDDILFGYFISIIKQYNIPSLPNLINKLRESVIFNKHFNNINTHLDTHKDVKFSQNFIYKLCNYGGYNTYNDLKHTLTIQYNHKVVSVTKSNRMEDTGCLTIKDPGNNHNFALASGVYVKNSDGKGSRVETLPGGSGLGELSDLEYFQARVYRGLRIPTSYMSTSSKDQNPIFNDGRIGQAYIEELRFAEFCMRLQRNIESVLDEEFKHYLRALNIEIDPSIFRLKLPEPTNFGIYKQQEADSAILSTLSNADSIGFLAKRFVLARFGQLEEEEILRNERLKCEELNIDPEDPDRFRQIYGSMDDADDFGGLGDLSGGDLGGDMSAIDMEPPEMDAGDEGLEEI